MELWFSEADNSVARILSIYFPHQLVSGQYGTR